MTGTHPVATLAACLLAAACTGKTPPPEAGTVASTTPAPQRAGQPMDPLKTTGHIAAARLAAITGEQDGARRNMESMSEDMRLAMKLPDAGRPIDPEAARAIVRTRPGARATWSDVDPVRCRRQVHFFAEGSG